MRLVGYLYEEWKLIGLLWVVNISIPPEISVAHCGHCDILGLDTK
jgi:hypothetical protein